MILSHDKAETIGERIVELVLTIIKGMGIGVDHARGVGDTIVNARVVRIDRMTFHVLQENERAATIIGIRAAASFIGHLLLTDAWMKEDVPNLIANLEAAAKTLAADDADAIQPAKIDVPAEDDGGGTKTPKTLDQSDQEHLLRKLRRVEKAAIEGMISRNALKNAISDLEDQIEHRYSSDNYDRFSGAIEILSNIFKV